MHQGPTIGHHYAQYEWDPFIHVWYLAPERMLSWSYMLSMGNPLFCHLSAILDWNFKMKYSASMGHRRHCSCISITRSGYSVLRTDSGKTPLPRTKIGHIGSHIGLGQKVTWRASRSCHRSWLCPIWMRSIHSCLRSGSRKESVNDRRTDGWTDTVPWQ